MTTSDIHREAFRSEAYELLGELEGSLLELEERPSDHEIIGKVFRAMHTIKGSGAMFGFDEIASFTHHIETVYDLIRNGDLGVTGELIDLTLRAKDVIREMLDTPESESASNVKVRKEMESSFNRFLPGQHETDKGRQDTVPKADGKKELESTEVTYRVRFKPPHDIFMRGIDPVNMLVELRTLGDCKIVAQTADIPVFPDFSSEYCYTYWDIIITTDKGINAIKDVFIFIEDDSEIKIESIYEEEDFDRERGYKKIGEILMERGDISPDELAKVLGQKKMIGEMLVESGIVQPDKLESALLEQKYIRELHEKKKGPEGTAIKVAPEKLDMLVNLVGELVTVQAHLNQTALDINEPRLSAIAEEVERLTAELRDNTMNIRMLPIGSTFSKFKRLVRDLSKELGKEIEMVTEGAETELDKTVIDKLNDPLVHLIRNSIDHGIEMPAVRAAKGKPGKGTVHLSALHSGANVLIRITDDGAGLDAVAIRKKALEKGLITAEAMLTEKEIFSLILEPGFSTAASVTSVSGRGVGMDVVKKAIESLRGSIDMESSKGRGTTITLKLPLTLAIIDGLLVNISGDFYVFPLSSVNECVELAAAARAATSGRNIANVRGRIVPYIRLREQFDIGGDLPDIEQIVINECGDMRVGFAVDSVIGQHQTVIKSLGSYYRDVEGISGATILGDGTVALILDVPKLVQKAEWDETESLVKVPR
jgi:two-component system chemotaxis sensor kinase CheA